MLSILLATYNNEQHVNQLIDSILNQSFNDFKLFIRDDCSTDSTFMLVSQYKDKRIEAVKSESQSGSAQNNFCRLLLDAEDDYIMFADADDVWMPNKIELTLQKMKQLEAEHKKAVPILIHTDLSVVDANLNVIAHSMFSYEKLSPNRSSLKNLLVQNNVTGCTVMINRALRSFIKQKPEQLVMHDWWAALIAAAFGEIGVVNQPTMLYRQHGENSIGAYNASDPLLAAKKLSQTTKIKKIYESMFLQADCFAQTYMQLLSPEQLKICTNYGALRNKTKLSKIITIVSNGFYKNTLVRNIGQFIAI